MNPSSIVVCNVEVDGRPGRDVRVEDGRIAEIGARLRGAIELDGAGGALIPGLADHHIHLFGLAALAESIDLDGVTNASQFVARVSASAMERPSGAWMRVVGYHETIAGDLTRRELDVIAPRHPLRVQHQSGALWILNSLALAAVVGRDDPPGLEKDRGGATGRLWREDAWLRDRLRLTPPSLARVGRRLAAFGITAATDASVTTESSTAAELGVAVQKGDLPLRLMLMSGGELDSLGCGPATVGPVKVLLDDGDLPDLDVFIATIARARDWRRAVAVHCVTYAELALTLAAFEAAGARPGDRVEHGGLIAKDAIAQIKTLGLMVVTQPGFVRERGDRYAAQVDPRDQVDLYRCGSLLRARIPVAASSDAPYASPDPWVGIATAADRRTRQGRVLGPTEQVSPAVALKMYLGHPAHLDRLRRIEVGAAADFCLLDAPLPDVLAEPSAERVRATVVAGRITHMAGAA